MSADDPSLTPDKRCAMSADDPALAPAKKCRPDDADPDFFSKSDSEEINDLFGASKHDFLLLSVSFLVTGTDQNSKSGHLVRWSIRF